MIASRAPQPNAASTLIAPPTPKDDNDEAETLGETGQHQLFAHVFPSSVGVSGQIQATSSSFGETEQPIRSLSLNGPTTGIHTSRSGSGIFGTRTRSVTTAPLTQTRFGVEGSKAGTRLSRQTNTNQSQNEHIGGIDRAVRGPKSKVFAVRAPELTRTPKTVKAHEATKAPVVVKAPAAVKTPSAPDRLRHSLYGDAHLGSVRGFIHDCGIAIGELTFSDAIELVSSIEEEFRALEEKIGTSHPTLRQEVLRGSLLSHVAHLKRLVRRLAQELIGEGESS